MITSNPVSRRGFFNRVSDGLYGAALAGLFSKDLYGANLVGARRTYDLKPRAPHFEPKAKSVIQLFMNGGPSQMDLFDPKPMLDKHHGEPYFDKVAADLTAPEERRRIAAQPLQVRAARPVGDLGLGADAAPGEASRRHRRDSLHVHDASRTTSRPCS